MGKARREMSLLGSLTKLPTHMANAICGTRARKIHAVGKK
jgi:hypothetical protein